MKNALCSYFPTTVAFVDDDPAFLRQVTTKRIRRNLPLQTFTEPQALLDFLSKDEYAEHFLSRIVAYGNRDVDYGEEILSVYVKKILQEIYNKERYNQISVVVVDYEMPSMKGLEVCQHIHSPYIKKILLTGVADEALAIEAFNKGLIYQYIRKHDPNYPEKLQAVIEAAQRDYFNTIFKIMLKGLEHSYYSTALLDPVFIDYFEKLLDDHQIKEYYLVETLGTYFMVDHQDRYKCLVTLVDDMLETFLPDNPTPSLKAETLQKLYDRKLIFCLNDPSEDFSLDARKFQEWNHYLKEPVILKGKNQTYYTYFGDNLIPVQEDKVQLHKVAGKKEEPKKFREVPICAQTAGEVRQ
jgi:CheY-like chemotaxis protein